MRKTLRYGLTFLTLLLGGLLVFTVETVVDEIGWTGMVRSLVRRGWSSMIEAGYVDWLSVAAIFTAGGSVALWVDHIIRSRTTVMVPFERKIKKTVKGATFRNALVKLDGIRYEGCAFHNVTFEYNGGTSELVNNDIYGCVVISEVPVIKSYSRLLHELGFLRVSFLVDGEKLLTRGATWKTYGSPIEDVTNQPQSPEGTEEKTPP